MAGPRHKRAAALLHFAALGLIFALLPIGTYLTGSLAWMRDLGFWAPAVLVAAYFLTSLVVNRRGSADC